MLTYYNKEGVRQSVLLPAHFALMAEFFFFSFFFLSLEMKQEKKVLGRFPLSECMGIQLADEDKIKRPFGFEIVTPERTFLICASNENEVRHSPKVLFAD